MLSMEMWVLWDLKVSPWPLGPGFHDQAVPPARVPRNCTLCPRYSYPRMEFFWYTIPQLIVTLSEVTATFAPHLPGVQETSVRYLPIRISGDAWDFSRGHCAGSWSLPEDSDGNGCWTLLAWQEGMGVMARG